MGTAPKNKSVTPGEGFAVLAAAIAAFCAATVLELPRWASPSNPPLDLTWLLPVKVLVGFLLKSALLVIWLLPGCVLARWVMRRRGVQGVRAALLVSGASVLVAWGTLYFFPALFEAPVRPALSPRLPVMMESAVFVMVWFCIVEWSSMSKEPTPDRSPRTVGTVVQRITGTALETTALLAVVCVASVMGGIGGCTIDEGEGEYRLQSTVDSPGGVKACLVTLNTPGGVLGETHDHVYLLDKDASWTPQNRGLLVWESRRMGVLGVEWRSAQSLRVRVSEDALRKDPWRASAYSRGGYTVQTWAAPGS